MKLGSLFDGSGGFCLAGIMNGIMPVWSSEIEPYPLRVTAARFPDVKQLGDVTKINGAEIEPVDVITFGSPCQDLSVAGKQAGLTGGARSSLFFEAIRIIKEMRDATADKFPRWAVWENVPGAFSSNKGEDFQAVIEAFCNVRGGANITVPQPPKGRWLPAGCVVGDGFSLAWRVYDAQYWGVPQRRKRIYLIADFGSERAGEILFEREGLPGDSEPRKETREGSAADPEGRAGRDDSVYTLKGNFIDRDTRQNGVEWGKNAMYTLDATDRHAVVYDARGNGDGQTAPTLTGDHQNRVTDYSALCIRCRAHGDYIEDGTASALKARDYKAGSVDTVVERPAGRKYIVRRLTPLECCRLQGFPDWWEDGVDGSDSARYKMWGNGIALPCANDVLRRIAEADRYGNEVQKDAKRVSEL